MYPGSSGTDPYSELIHFQGAGYTSTRQSPRPGQGEQDQPSTLNFEGATTQSYQNYHITEGDTQPIYQSQQAEYEAVYRDPIQQHLQYNLPEPSVPSAPPPPPQGPPDPPYEPPSPYPAVAASQVLQQPYTQAQYAEHREQQKFPTHPGHHYPSQLPPPNQVTQYTQQYEEQQQFTQPIPLESTQYRDYGETGPQSSGNQTTQSPGYQHIPRTPSEPSPYQYSQHYPNNHAQQHQYSSIPWIGQGQSGHSPQVSASHNIRRRTSDISHTTTPQGIERTPQPENAYHSSSSMGESLESQLQYQQTAQVQEQQSVDPYATIAQIPSYLGDADVDDVVCEALSAAIANCQRLLPTAVNELSADIFQEVYGTTAGALQLFSAVFGPFNQVQAQSPEHRRQCLGCDIINNTPEWRRGPKGPRTLCNACGLFYIKILKKRAQEQEEQARREATTTTTNKDSASLASSTNAQPPASISQWASRADGLARAVASQPAFSTSSQSQASTSHSAEDAQTEPPQVIYHNQAQPGATYTTWHVGRPPPSQGPSNQSSGM